MESLSGSTAQARRWLDSWAFGRKHALRGAAACRIATGLSVLGLLLSNLSSRDLWVGQASIWAEPARVISRFPELALLKGVSGDILTLVYVVTMLAALAFVGGWHTKAANVITFVGFIAIVGQNPVVGAQSDNLVRLTLLWMLMMRTAEHWSLDCRRRAHTTEDDRESRAREDDVLPVWLSTGLHNIGLFSLATQAILTYMAGGLDKISQSEWRHGTALYYTMQLPEYRPFPGLSDLLSQNRVVLASLTYAVLLVQLFFGPLLLNPVTRRLVLALAVAVSVFFAVVFALPWSSLATIAVTSLFVADTTWQRIETGVLRGARPAGDWIVDRGYAIADKVDDARYRFVLPVIDRVRETFSRR
ncbi:HTTM domain-containing protein [Aeromicrobium sp.]|uniref:HTTM domain-containing protein n=1 Tax=Aeromicrobium sp. TaxID=1871063 RepID=UPI0019AF4B24|nr:HTTM domain-containing protein [Aeromicrobium sp.]MBC7632389.1 HTTM domain-containing protein [Aeromicrobium sp.]